MTKGILFAASLALFTAVAACSADTTTTESEPTTDTNGTEPSVDEAKLPEAKNVVSRTDIAAARDLAERGDRRSVHGVREFAAPSPVLAQPEIAPKHD